MKRNLALAGKPDSFRAAPAEARDHLTDLGAAETFATAHGHEVRYDHRRGRWLIWRGHRWAPDNDQQIVRLATAHLRDRQREALTIADLDRRDRTVHHLMALERRGALDSMLILARAQLPIADSGESWDTDPWLLGVQNGVVDLRTGERRDGRPEDRITMTTGVPFDADARCPRWERFLREVMSDDTARVEFLRLAAGYSLTGAVREQAFFWLTGAGENGKTTLLETLTYVLGDYATATKFGTFVVGHQEPTGADLAALAGRRLVMASETQVRGRLDEERLKCVTGGDTLSARHLYQEPFTFRPVLKLWLSTNHKPTVQDDSHAFWRRVRLLPFERTFSGSAGDRTLANTLRAEAPGILAWMVRGCLDWQAHGLPIPEAVERATNEYREDSDLFGQFVNEACDLEPGGECKAADFYSAYRVWAEHQGFGERERLTATRFGQKAAERFRRDKTRTGWVYLGVQSRRV